MHHSARETKSADTSINLKLPDISELEMQYALLEYINHSYWQLPTAFIIFDLCTRLSISMSVNLLLALNVRLSVVENVLVLYKIIIIITITH